jgi:integrase
MDQNRAGPAAREHRDNLTKRCDCGPRKQLKCDHPWHIDFYRGKKFRYSLDVLAKARGEQPPRTKDEAESFRDRLRGEIRAGTFRDPNAEPEPQPDASALTVGDVIDHYIRRHVKSPTRRVSAQQTMLWHLGVLRRTEIPAARGQSIRFDEKPIKDVSKADIEAVRDARRRAGPIAVAARQQWDAEAAELAKRNQPMDRPKPRLLPGVKAGEVGINRLLERARHLFAWAIEEGYIDATPFKRGGQVVVRLTHEEPRDRRLDDPGDGQRPGEEDRLLQQAGPHLRALIIAGVATGCRVGELLGLQWKDYKVTAGPNGQTRRVLLLAADKTKTNKAREVPIGSRLAAVLEMRRHAPDGRPLGPDAFVFGNAVGERIGSVRKAWQTAVLKAHGHTPQWVKGKKNQLGPESLAAYRSINLHFHDLRREFGSRVLESGSSLVDARDLLGHANISQTSTYLNSTATALGLAIERKEEYERQQANARETRAKNSHTNAECDNWPTTDLDTPDPLEVVKH